MSPNDGVQMIEVVLAALDVPAAQVQAMTASLSEAEQSRAARIRCPRLRERFVVARGRLRQLLAERLGLAPEALELGRGRHGKPELAPALAASGWRFNLAHSQALALYAFAREREVGVDLEAVREFPEAAQIAAHHFSAAERACWRAAPREDRARAFLTVWTRKEAVAKALGEGLARPLAELDVAQTRPGWHLESFSPAPGYIAALAARPA